MNNTTWLKHCGIDVCLVNDPDILPDVIKAIVYGKFKEEEKKTFFQHFPFVSYISYPTAQELKQHTDKNGEGKKFDEGKIRFELLPPEALSQVAQVFTDGAKKYGDRNWEKGILWSRLLGATLRHLFSWSSGTTNDQESGHNLLAHACASLLMLLEYHNTHKKLDDRGYKNE